MVLNNSVVKGYMENYRQSEIECCHHIIMGYAIVENYETEIKYKMEISL